MGTDQPAPTESTQDQREGARGGGRRRGLLSPTFWLQVVLGLAVAGYGVYILDGSGWKSPTGFLLLCVGVLLVPIWFARLFGGLGLVALAVWLGLHALGMFDYLLAAVYVFVGGTAAMDGVRDIRMRLRRT